jgi:hypothetical protein
MKHKKNIKDVITTIGLVLFIMAFLYVSITIFG